MAKRLSVGHLTLAVMAPDLRDLCGQPGAVKWVQLPGDRRIGRTGRLVMPG